MHQVKYSAQSTYFTEQNTVFQKAFACAEQCRRFFGQQVCVTNSGLRLNIYIKIFTQVSVFTNN